MNDPAILEETVETFRRWLYLPDAAPLLAAAGSIAANRMPGDPVWLLLIGPPGGGKSELLNAFRRLPNVHPAATLTEASLLSGTPKRDVDANSQGGLLRAIGDYGILLLKDFTSVLSMHRDERGKVIAALREIYDGAWTRHVGVDGGRALHWEGRIGLLAGVTPTIDRYHGVMGAMGERFVNFRLRPVDEREQAMRSLEHAGHELRMRKELGQAIEKLMGRDFGQPAERTPDERESLVELARLIVRARSAVERDNYTREVELVGEPEAPTRFVVVLSRLLDGLLAIGCTEPQAWQIVGKVGFDSVPQLRRDLLETLAKENDAVETGVLAEMMQYPTTTTRRSLEDLTAHGLVMRTSGGAGKADEWWLSDWSRDRLEAIVRDSFTANGSHPAAEQSDLAAIGLDPDADIPF